MLAELLHRTRLAFSGVYLTDSSSSVLKAGVHYGERHRTHRCKSYMEATKPNALAIRGSAVRCT